MLANCFAERKAISVLGCAAQVYFRGVCMVTECSLLAALACDCYMAICNPLLYVVTMSSIMCATFPDSDTISVLILTSCSSILAVVLKYTLC